MGLFCFSQLEDFQMAKKPTYEELEQRVKELEKACFDHERLREASRGSEESHSEIAGNRF